MSLIIIKKIKAVFVALDDAITALFRLVNIDAEVERQFKEIEDYVNKNETKMSDKCYDTDCEHREADSRNIDKGDKMRDICYNKECRYLMPGGVCDNFDNDENITDWCKKYKGKDVIERINILCFTEMAINGKALLVAKKTNQIIDKLNEGDDVD